MLISYTSVLSVLRLVLAAIRIKYVIFVKIRMFYQVFNAFVIRQTNFSKPEDIVEAAIL